MQQTLTAKLQIFPKPSDRQLLFDTTKAYSAACTYVSDYVHANHIYRKQRIRHVGNLSGCARKWLSALPVL